jgi:DNA-directed RNA polymerase subunit beta'
VIEVLEKKRMIKVLSDKKKVLVYKVPSNVPIIVKKGDKVKKGQALSEGSLDLKKLFKIAGKEVAQDYILNEVQKVYCSQGVDIHDKHIEIIIRQMFSRVRITKEGDGPWIKGEIVSSASVEEVNRELKKMNKELVKAQPILLGISRVALSSDSFLSAASFQETSRVLINASLLGKEDRLLGLKENVIIGKLIPAGTGFRKDFKKS